MLAFRETERSFGILGIGSTQNRFNGKMLMTIIACTTDNILNYVYLFYVAERFIDRVDSIFFCSVTTFILLIYIITIFQWEKLSTHIDDVRQFVEEREYITMHIERASWRLPHTVKQYLFYMFAGV